MPPWGHGLLNSANAPSPWTRNQFRKSLPKCTRYTALGLPPPCACTNLGTKNEKAGNERYGLETFCAPRDLEVLPRVGGARGPGGGTTAADGGPAGGGPSALEGPLGAAADPEAPAS